MVSYKDGQSYRDGSGSDGRNNDGGNNSSLVIMSRDSSGLSQGVQSRCLSPDALRRLDALRRFDELSGLDRMINNYLDSLKRSSDVRCDEIVQQIEQEYQKCASAHQFVREQFQDVCTFFNDVQERGIGWHVTYPYWLFPMIDTTRPKDTVIFYQRESHGTQMIYGAKIDFTNKKEAPEHSSHLHTTNVPSLRSITVSLGYKPSDNWMSRCNILSFRMPEMKSEFVEGDYQKILEQYQKAFKSIVEAEFRISITHEYLTSGKEREFVSSFKFLESLVRMGKSLKEVCFGLFVELNRMPLREQYRQLTSGDETRKIMSARFLPGYGSDNCQLGADGVGTHGSQDTKCAQNTECAVKIDIMLDALSEASRNLGCETRKDPHMDETSGRNHAQHLLRASHTTINRKRRKR